MLLDVLADRDRDSWALDCRSFMDCQKIFMACDIVIINPSSYVALFFINAFFLSLSYMKKAKKVCEKITKKAKTNRIGLPAFFSFEMCMFFLQLQLYWFL